MSFEEFRETLIREEKLQGPRAFIRRAWASWLYQMKIYVSYRMNLALDIIDIVLSALIYYYVSFLVSPEDLVKLGYTPDYIAFALSGIALSRYLWTTMARLAHKMRHEISAGTFESLASIDSDNFKSWIAGQIFYGATWSSSTFILTIMIGYFLGAKFTRNPLVWIQAVLIVLLVVTIHAAIGIMAAGMYIIHKQLETLLVLMISIIEFFGGVIYPLALLWNYPLLYYIALLMPFTHGLELFRRTLIDEKPITDPRMLMHLGALCAFIPLIYVGLRVYDHYLMKAKRLGLLSSY